MKRLLIALMMLPALAQAQSWEINNQSKGKIILTTTECSDKPNQYVVFSTNPTGGTIFGCWFPAEGYVMVVWGDGTVSTFEGKSFKLRQQ